MKFIKKIPTALFLIGLFILLLISSYLLYEYNLRAYRIKVGIKPFSELLEIDFVDLEEIKVDENNCDVTRVVDYLEAVKNSKVPVSGFKDYDPDIHKLTILDDCWRQYENEYVRFKFRDLNGSLLMTKTGIFNLAEGSKNTTRTFGLLTPDKNSLPYNQAIIAYLEYTGHTFIKTDTFINPNGVIIDRTETYSPQVTKEKSIYYTIDLPEQDKFIYLLSHSKRVSEEILSSIELK